MIIRRAFQPIGIILTFNMSKRSSSSFLDIQPDSIQLQQFSNFHSLHLRNPSANFQKKNMKLITRSAPKLMSSHNSNVLEQKMPTERLLWRYVRCNYMHARLRNKKDYERILLRQTCYSPRFLHHGIIVKFCTRSSSVLSLKFREHRSRSFRDVRGWSGRRPF